MLLSLCLSIALSIQPAPLRPLPNQVRNRIGAVSSEKGDGHMLPGWSDLALFKRATALQREASAKEAQARAIVAELDQAFVDLQQIRPRVSILQKISELEYRITGLSSSLLEAERMLSMQPERSWDRTFTQVLRNDIAAVREEMSFNRIYFERQYEHERLKRTVSPAFP